MGKVVIVFIVVSGLVLTGCTSTTSVSLVSHFQLAKDKVFLVVQNTSDHNVVITGITSEVEFVRLPKGTADPQASKSGQKKLSTVRSDPFLVKANAPVELAPGKKRKFKILGYQLPREDYTLAIRATLKSKGLTVKTGLELDGSMLRDLKRRWLRLNTYNTGVSTKDLVDILGFVGRKSKHNVLGITVKNSKIWIYVGKVKGPLSANGSVLVFERKPERWLLVDEWDWAS